MTLLRRKMFTYVKLVFLIFLVGILYLRDLAEIWQTILATDWIFFTIVILSLIGFSLLQKRKPLKTLMLISESNGKQGAVFLCFMLIFYLVRPYTQYALWIRLCSLLLFIVTYLLLICDRRIPRMFFLPLISVLLVFPPIGIEIFEIQNLLLLGILYFVTDTILVLLAVQVLNTSKWWKSKATHLLDHKKTSRSGGKSKYCPLCQSTMLSEEIFCPHCGKQQKSITPKPIKPTLTKFAILFSIAFTISLHWYLVDWLNLMGLWRIHVSTLNEIYTRFRDIFLTAASVGVIFLLASWVRTNDERKELLSENAFSLLESEADLIATISMMKKRRFSGKELFEAYMQFADSDMDLNRFYEKINNLSAFGLLEKSFVVKDDELRLIWKSKLP